MFKLVFTERDRDLLIKNGLKCIGTQEFNGIKAYVFENKNEIVFSKNNIKSITTNKLYF